MRFLTEDYGESEELDNFVHLLDDRFSEYYMVTLKDGRISSRKYFSFENAAKEYYDKWLKDAKKDKAMYDGYSITLTKVTLEPEYEDQKEETIYDEEDNE